MNPPGHLPGAVRQAWRDLEGPDAFEFGGFDPSLLHDLPTAVRRWLGHSIEPGAPLRHTARLSMHGSIKIGRWTPFTAEQVLAPEGFIWAAVARRFPMTIRGFDRYSDGTGEMCWKIARVLPVMTASGDDITRSAAGRLAGETMLLPGAAMGGNVVWHSETDDTQATATVTTGPFTHEVTIEVDPEGRLTAVSLPRWGNPGDGGFAEHTFGVEMDGEHDVDGYLIPANMRAGWWYGADRWPDGEFFRAEIDDCELI